MCRERGRGLWELLCMAMARHASCRSTPLRQPASRQTTSPHCTAAAGLGVQRHTPALCCTAAGSHPLRAGSAPPALPPQPAARAAPPPQHPAPPRALPWRGWRCPGSPPAPPAAPRSIVQPPKERVCMGSVSMGGGSMRYVGPAYMQGWALHAWVLDAAANLSQAAAGLVLLNQDHAWQTVPVLPPLPPAPKPAPPAGA